MKLFLDTAFIEQVEEAKSWGILDGVTTNPTHVAHTGLPAREVYRQILAAVDVPVSLECVALDAEGIVREARELAALADHVVVKVPIICEGLKAVKQLAAEGIKTNVTLNFSAMQALLAAKCGATYISPFVGRLDLIGHCGMDLVREIKTIYGHYGFKTQIISAALRHPRHVLESALAGAEVATMPLDIMRQLYYHPMTDAGLTQFLADWKTVPEPAGAN